MGLGKTYSTKYLLDSNNSSGVAGQVLVTTAEGVNWQDAESTGDNQTQGSLFDSKIVLIDTPNGGLKPYRVITDEYGEWIQVGRFAASAMTTIQSVWSSVSPLSTGTAQSETTQFSADFGDCFPDEVRIMGATDFDNWRNTRTIDWVYKVPPGRKWKFFFSNGETTGMGTVDAVKYGWTVNGAYDGFGRWTNQNLVSVRMSDRSTPIINTAAAYTTPTANAFNWETNSDAKFSVSATRVFCGQDTFVTSGVGNDDNLQGFFDEYPGETTNMQGGVDFSSAVWVLIKVPGGASGGGGDDAYWSANGNDIHNDNTGNVGIGITGPTAKLHLFTSGAEAINLGIQNSERYYKIETDGGFLTFNDISAGGAARMVINSSGNVGIGTTSPGNHKLNVHMNQSYGSFGPSTGFNVTNESTSLDAGFITVSARYNNPSPPQLYYKTGGIGGGKETAAGNSQWGGYLSFWTTSDGTAGAASGMFEHMRITADGEVGIGTISPGAKLEVRSDGSASGGAEIRLQHANNNTNDVVSTVNFANNAGSIGMMQAGTAGANNTGYIALFTDIAGASSERMRVHTNSNVGINTTNPGRKLTIANDVTGDANNLLLSNENDTDGDSASIGFSMLSNNTYVKSGIFFKRTTTQGRGDLMFANNNEVNGNNVTLSDVKMTIKPDGNVGIGTGGFAQKRLDVSGPTGGQVLITGASDDVGTTSGIMFRSEASEENGLARVKGGIFFERIAGTYGNGKLKFAVNSSANNDTVAVSDVAITIDTNKNVGIGTDSPTGYKLFVENTSEDLLKLHNSTDGLDSLISFTNPGGTLGRIQGIDNGGLGFDVGNNAGGIVSNAMFIKNDGNVGIRDTNPTSISVNTSSITVNSTRADLSGGYITKANGTIKNQMYWDNTGFRFDLSPSSGDFNFKVGNTDKVRISKEGNISTPKQELTSTAIHTNKGLYTTEIRLIDTPNGGLKQCRVITDNYGEWILVGRFAADARAKIQAVWSSESGLDTSTAQDNVTRFSADFGDSLPSEVRIMGSTDFDRWRDNRTIDFIYGVPEGRKWKYFFSGGVENGMIQSTKYGWGINGAYDGFGRWVNPAQNFVRMSDTNVTNPSAAYTTATTNAFNWNGASDAKMSVSSFRVFSGQDTLVTSGFGADDNVQGFFDDYPGEAGNMTGGSDFSSAVWVLIKLPKGTSSGGGDTDYWVADGNNIHNNNTGIVNIKGPSAQPANGNQTLSIQNTTGGTQLNLGTAENSYGWIEAREGATLRNLLLSPNGGNIGIGVTAPPSKLTIETSAGDGTIELLALNAATTKNKIIFSEAVLGDESFFIEHDGAGAGADNLLKIHGDGSGGAARGITIRRDGRVGIGNNSPDLLLHVGDGNASIADLQGAIIEGHSDALDLRTNEANSIKDFTPALNLFCDGVVGSSGTGSGIYFRAKTGGGGGAEFTKGRIQGAVYTSWTTNTDATRTSKLVIQTTNAGTHADRVTILGDGSFGINDTSPSNTLDVNGDIRGTQYKLRGNVDNPSDTAATIYDKSGVGLTFSAHNVAIRNYNGTNMIQSAFFTHNAATLAGTCTATNFILSSDKTLKENIKDINNNHIDVNWKNFELKSEPGIKRSGVIAQELEINHPEFVRTNKDGLKSVAYIDLLIAKIAELEARLEKAGI